MLKLSDGSRRRQEMMWKMVWLGVVCCAVLPLAAVAADRVEDSSADAVLVQEDSGANIIVPGVGVGEFTLGMSKDDVLKRLGEPRSIFLGGERYTLDNLPAEYYMYFGDISFHIAEGCVKEVGVLGPLYKFANGLGVGDREQKIKQAFGDDFEIQETGSKDFLTYADEGLAFEIDKKNRTAMEINVSQKNPRGQRDSSAKPIASVDEYDNVAGKDLSRLDLSARKNLIDTLEFDRKTIWPEPAKMPPGVDPNKILLDAVNPGLGVRELHRQGITGKGVSVAIIDQPLSPDDPEYAGKIAAYHDTGCGGSKTSMHGPGMTIQLVGNQCGTAPGARVYYAAVPSWKADAAFYADALDWIVAQNEGLPASEKIRVVSVSAQPSGPGSPYKNPSLWDEAVERAEAKGILVLDCTWNHGFVSVCWYDPRDRESVESCTPGFRKGPVEVDEGHIHVPVAPRTVGGAYDGGGGRSSKPKSKNGYSDAIPYAAGILALGWQVRPESSSQQMRDLLFKSAFTHESGAKIINPKEFIRLVKSTDAVR
jgi:serine protease AprX